LRLTYGIGFRETGASQEGRRIDVAHPKGDNRLRSGEPGCGRKSPARYLFVHRCFPATADAMKSLLGLHRKTTIVRSPIRLTVGFPFENNDLRHNHR
jgi:hypothetical protein